MSLSDSVRQQVRARAKHYCEYCLSHQDYIMGHLQIDHIQPIAKGGNDSISNLCLACELCNQYKWTKTEAQDPETGEDVKIFNPRQQKWIDHFAWNSEGTQIIGLTAVGRATIAALQLNNSLAVIVRSNWVKAGWHPPSFD